MCLFVRKHKRFTVNNVGLVWKIDLNTVSHFGMDYSPYTVSSCFFSPALGVLHSDITTLKAGSLTMKWKLLAHWPRNLKKRGVIMPLNLVLVPDCVYCCIESYVRCQEKGTETRHIYVVWLLMKKCLQENERSHFREQVNDWFSLVKAPVCSVIAFLSGIFGRTCHIKPCQSSGEKKQSLTCSLRWVLLFSGGKRSLVAFPPCKH